MKQLLVMAVVFVVVWQVGKAVSHSGKSSSNTPAPTQTTGPAPPSPTPIPTVTLGGHPVAAGGNPVILVQPGMVSPGGVVTVEGSGFDPGSSVGVWLQEGRQSAGQVIARSKTTKWGTVTIVFKLPISVMSQNTTVVAQESGGAAKTADAKILTPAGIGQVVIAGKGAGQPGAMVTVKASGFGPNEKVNVYWGRMTGPPAATLTASPAGTIGQATIPVGIAPTGPTTLVLVGQTTKTTATAPYLMLGLYPTVTPHPYAVKAGHPVTVTGKGFAPGEQVLFYLNATSGWPAATGTASAQGGMAFSFVVPFGLKGKQTLTAVGNQSHAAVATGFTVLPYMPQAMTSTYGAMPGTTISFYVSGFAANEVVYIYQGRAKNNAGTLVGAFRVNAQGSAANVGSYMIPNAGGGLTFALVGQKSGGTATATIKVTAAPAPVNVPPQTPYVLPPSLGGTPTASPSTPPPAKAKPKAKP